MDARVISQDMTDLERTEMMKHLEKGMQGWVYRVEKGDLSGFSLLPPLEILMVPDLIKRAWYPDRLIPWLPGFIKWETYLDYLGNFFEWNREVLLTLDGAIRQYLELEKKFVLAREGVLSDEDLSLNKRINDRIEEIRAQQDLMSQDELCLAAASFMCIAAETNLMSELTPCNLSNCVRGYALDLMFNNGSGCAAVSAALLGMTKEATLMVGCNGGKPDMEIDVCRCLDVRARTLAILPILKTSYARHTDGDHDRDVASHTVKSKSNAPIEVVHQPHTSNEPDHSGTVGSKDDETPRYNKINKSKKVSRIGKTKALFKSLFLKSKKRSQPRDAQTSEPRKT